MKKLQQLIFLSALIIISSSCERKSNVLSISDKEGINNCLSLEQIIKSQDVNEIVLTRPFGNLLDTTVYRLDTITHLYGQRLFTLGNEMFQCRDIDSLVTIENTTINIKYNKRGTNNFGPFKQEFVSNFWEVGNGHYLNKKLPSFIRKSYSGEIVNLDSLIASSEKTLIHFGWLNCRGCMLEQQEIAKLIDEYPDMNFVNMTINKSETLDKYLVDKGEYFEVLPPYNKLSKTMNKPLFFDEDMFKLFKLEGLFPVNFLVNKSRVVEEIGHITELFNDGNTEIFTTY
jgi:thiol-disulfide isomerase/thioredoxin